jgi:1-acyl-sn-glycerol-3-phosphate acyltransferase
MKYGDVIYYRDELNDDFAGNGIRADEIHADFPFMPKGFLWRVGEFIAYHIIAIPIVFVICTVFGGMRFENRREVKRALSGSGRGIFLYANHTHWLDAFVGPLVSWPRKAHVLASADTFSIKGLRTFVQMLGAIPVPTEREAIKPFCETVSARIAQGRPVMIFPEAHIWPFCTFIRDFKAGSFRYPVREGVPAVAVCVTYRRRKLLRFLRSPRRTVYVSRPFHPDKGLPDAAAKQKLRDEVYEWLKSTAEAHSDYEFVHYEKAED